MDLRDVSCRELLIQGSAAFAGLMVLQSPLLAQAFPSRPGEEVILIHFENVVMYWTPSRHQGYAVSCTRAVGCSQ